MPPAHMAFSGYTSPQVTAFLFRPRCETLGLSASSPALFEGDEPASQTKAQCQGLGWHAHITQLSANKIVHMKTKPMRQQPSLLQLKDLPDEGGAGTCWRARCSAQRVAGGGAVLAFAAAADGAGGGTAASGAGSAWFCGCAHSGGRLPGAAASAAAPAAPLPPCPGPPLEPGGPAAPRGSIAPQAAAALVGSTAGAAGSACAAVRAEVCSSPRPLSAALPRWTAAAAAVAATAAAGWLVAVCVLGVRAAPSGCPLAAAAAESSPAQQLMVEWAELWRRITEPMMNS